jgi:phytoene dehydrogenase-like protein
MGLGHLFGWPFPRGGADSIADALGACFETFGGRIETEMPITSLSQLPSAKAILLDLTPRQLLALAPKTWSGLYSRQLKNYQYGMGIFKVDWALDAPIPFASEACRSAGTVHIGGTFEEVAYAEALTAQGKLPEKPFVLLAQQSLFDPTRAPRGKHTAWAYCHVPNGCTINRTEVIENQVERFAPGFKERILGRHTMNAMEMEAYNPNYVGGDIGGGSMKLSQLFTRPALRTSPYRTSEKGIYICSSATPPGGGVHGMCGYHAATQVLKDLF